MKDFENWINSVDGTPSLEEAFNAGYELSKAQVWINGDTPPKNCCALAYLDDESYALLYYKDGIWLDGNLKDIAPFKVLKYCIFPTA